MDIADHALASIEDIRRALAEDARMAGWTPRDATACTLELEEHRVRVLLLWPDAWQPAEERARHLSRARASGASVLLLGSEAQLAAAGSLDQIDPMGDAQVQLVPVPVPLSHLLLALRNAAAFAHLRCDAGALELALDRARYENDMLITVGRALSQQRDLRPLLELILRRAREVTGADAGSIYVVEGDDDGPARRSLRFMISENDSIAVESKGFTMQVSESSIVGLCVLSGEDINIPDLYALDPPGAGNNPWGFVHDRSFDDRHDYQTRSMLTVPMISARQQVIGVIQLINKRGGKRQHERTSLCTPADFERDVVAFDHVSVNYAKSLASQAGIALENAMLYEEVKTLFEGFVRASVTAIESRDPTTSGHSERVASLTLGLARVTDRVESGPYAALRLSADEMTQIEYAALLHDFGKVGVREHVLVKAKKLYPMQREMVLQRFHYIKKTLEAEVLRSKVDYLMAASRDRMLEDMDRHLATVDAEAAVRLAELDEFVRFVLTANEPSVLEQGGFERITGIAGHLYIDGDGQERPYLTPEEVVSLQVLRGSLTPEERFEIESHVVHTFNFLKQIPWGRTFRHIPDIAGTHHEKLDGSGYPNGRRGDAIPVPARMMTISDIYDALTAADRPYKKAVPVDRALDILTMEVDQGRLDRELFRLFVDAKVYEQTGS